MTLTIDLPDEQTLVLQAKAKAPGVSAEQYARHVLENDLVRLGSANHGRALKENGADQLSRDEIDAEISAARKASRSRVHDSGGSSRARPDAED